MGVGGLDDYFNLYVFIILGSKYSTSSTTEQNKKDRINTSKHLMGII